MISASPSLLLPCRKAYCPANKGKPALVISTDFGLYVGNESDQEMQLSASELCGFNTGSFQQKAITGQG